jgi:hypothetical protein
MDQDAAEDLLAALDAEDLSPPRCVKVIARRER